MPAAKIHFSEHPNWCAMGDAVDRLDSMIDHSKVPRNQLNRVRVMNQPYLFTSPLLSLAV